jgi:hypothetical protein
MGRTDVSVTTRKKLKKLVDKKYRLLGLAEEINKGKENFIEEIGNLKKKMAETGSEVEKDKYVTEGKNLYQKFEENILTLSNKIKNIQI